MDPVKILIIEDDHIQNDVMLPDGLGLFIVEQSLNLMKLPFTFAPIPDGSGMRVCIEL